MNSSRVSNPPKTGFIWAPAQILKIRPLISEFEMIVELILEKRKWWVTEKISEGKKNPEKFAPVLIVPVEGQGMTNEITGVLVQTVFLNIGL